MGSDINKTPKRQILAWKDVVKITGWWDLCAWRRDQKRKTNKPNAVGKLGIRPDHTRRRIDIKFSMAVVFGGSFKFKFHQNWLSSFWDVGCLWQLAYTTACSNQHHHKLTMVYKQWWCQDQDFIPAFPNWQTEDAF